MASVAKIFKDCIEFQFQGINVLGALKQNLSIPFSTIAQIKVINHVHINEFVPFFCVRVGTFFPSVVAEGRFYSKEGKSFLNIHQNKPAIYLKLVNASYSYVVIELDNPKKVAEDLKALMPEA